MKLPLSVLDLCPVYSGATAAEAYRNTIDLARLADRLGYVRYWLAEHHNIPGIAATVPEIMIGQVARETERIRVGSGGVMLPNHAPLRVVEAFRTLEALFPGRIDLGIGRAPGTDTLTALALRRSREALRAEDFADQLAELLAFGTGEFPADHPFRSITAMPGDVALPPVWLLGSSGYSAQLAAMVGLGFAHAYHIEPDTAVESMRAYRAGFTPSDRCARPHVIITAPVVCAETDAHAEYLASSIILRWVLLRTGRAGPIPSPEEAMAYRYSPMEQRLAQQYRSRLFIGSAATVRARIAQHVEETGADEVMVVTVIYGHAERRRSYELLAEAFEL